MIERLFSSPALYATLALFFDYPHDPLFPRLISRHTGTDIKSVLRELNKLKGIGLVRVRRAGKEKHYRLNEEFPLYEEMASIFEKTRTRRKYSFHGLQLAIDCRMKGRPSASAWEEEGRFFDAIALSAPIVPSSPSYPSFPSTLSSRPTLGHRSRPEA